MGVYDRDYYRQDSFGGRFQVKSVVGILIGINLAVWLLQVAFYSGPTQHSWLERAFACNPGDLFGSLHFWQPLTANFLHDPKQMRHILFNMFFLFVFGREMEALYGKRRFLFFYLAAGSVAILTEAAYQHWNDQSVSILGASGAVMGTVVLFTLHFPKREIAVFGILPVPVWILCSIFVVLDLLGAMKPASAAFAGEGTRVAFLAHLAGAAFAALYRLREVKGGSWHLGLPRRFKVLRGGGSPPRSRVRKPQPVAKVGTHAENMSETELVSKRIDQLLEKISLSGQDSLTAEELEYLQKNSGRYRSKK